MDLKINLETLEDEFIEVPITGIMGLQVRHDGVLLNGKLYFWEEIMWMSITNKGLLDKLRKQKKTQ